MKARKKGLKVQFISLYSFNQMCFGVRDECLRSVASEQSPIAKAASSTQSITVTDLGVNVSLRETEGEFKQAEALTKPSKPFSVLSCSKARNQKVKPWLLMRLFLKLDTLEVLNEGLQRV